MKITRSWAMPSKNTFHIKPIKELLVSYVYKCKTEQMGLMADPFVGQNPFKDKCSYTNDLNKEVSANYHLDALEFLKQIPDNEISLMFFDLPYSPRQVAECYKKHNMAVNMQTTQASYWSNLKKEIARVVNPGGFCITCGWNSGGIGKTLGFEIIEILLVAHGGWHNDTIVTVEKKILTH